MIFFIDISIIKQFKYCLPKNMRNCFYDTQVDAPVIDYILEKREN